jgi:peptidoglycan/LPS O-acetylase OafA/YrhL
MAKVYFPNLNGLRFVAAFSVIIHHIEQYKFLLNEPNLWHVPFFDVVGKVAVILFFVLSGFLITYLLLDEERTTGKISIGAFYLRRVRRIWPVYYLLVFLGLFVFPAIPIFYLPGFTGEIASGFAGKLILLLLILPNLIVVPIPGIYQTWSIGVEEQFYLIWPVLFKKIRNPVLICCLVLAGYLLIKFVALPVLSLLTHDPSWVRTAIRIWGKFSVDCMAIGGLTAIALHRKQERILRWLFSIPVQLLAYVISAVMIGYGVVIPYVNFECYAVLFAIIILNLAANPNSLVRLESKPLHYLGKISYGLYMYHLAAIAIAHYLTQQIAPGNNVLLYGLSVVLSIGISAASYEWFESRFLRTKKRTIVAEKPPVVATQA